MLTRPTTLNLSNWRQHPHQRWAFRHVREIIPSEAIHRAKHSSQIPSAPMTVVDEIETPGLGGESWSIQRWLAESSSDALLVAHRGQLVHEWYVDEEVEASPHIVFSVSKSITAILAGVLVERGLLDPARLVTDYLPELNNSGYRGATVQQVLDMVVSIDFNEDYLATEGSFVEYRQSTAWHPCAVDEIDQNLHDFLGSIGPGDGRHGDAWRYRSPNSDLLGWLLERVGGERFAQLMSQYLWQPMGAEKNAYVTVDRKGAARTAGGICVVPRDLMRFAELVRNRGRANGQQVVPESWIMDCSDAGSREAWQRGESAKEFPDGQYRNKWYQTGDQHRSMLAIGIHSQWIYINPVTEVSIIKLSSQNEPLRLDLDAINLQAFTNINAAVAGQRE